MRLAIAPQLPRAWQLRAGLRVQCRVEQRKGQHSGNVVQLGSGAAGQHGALRTFHILRRPHHSFLFRRSRFFHRRSVGQLQSQNLK